VSHGRRRAPDAGFTLLELSAVVVILVLLVGMVLPSLGLGERRALDGEAEGLRADLELARQRAIATGAPQRLTVDLDDASYRLEQWATEPAVPEERPPAARTRRPAIATINGIIRQEAASVRTVKNGGILNIDARFHGEPEGAVQAIEVHAGGNPVGTFETAEGATRHGTASVAFYEDGSASPARIRLETHSGEALELDVLPLADAVRVRAVD